MKIYQVLHVQPTDVISYEISHMSPYYSTKEKAEQWCKNNNVDLTRPTYEWASYYYIQEYEVH